MRLNGEEIKKKIVYDFSDVSTKILAQYFSFRASEENCAQNFLQLKYILSQILSFYVKWSELLSTFIL